MLPMFKATPQVMFCKAVEDLRRFCFHIFYRHKMGSFQHWLDLWKEGEVAWSEVWRVGRVLKHSDVSLAKNRFIDNALWAGALSWCNTHQFLHNSGRFLLTCSRNIVKTSLNTADLPSGRWAPTLPSQYPRYQGKQSTRLWTSNDSCVLFFFGLGDDDDFHCIDCRLVSGS